MLQAVSAVLVCSAGATPGPSAPPAAAASPGPRDSPISRVVLVGLNIVLPLINAELLKFPKLAQLYYSLLSYMLEVYPKAVAELAPQHFASLMASLEWGLLGSDTVAVHCSLEGLAGLAKFQYQAVQTGSQGLAGQSAGEPQLVWDHFEALICMAWHACACAYAHGHHIMMAQHGMGTHSVVVAGSSVCVPPRLAWAATQPLVQPPVAPFLCCGCCGRQHCHQPASRPQRFSYSRPLCLVPLLLSFSCWTLHCCRVSAGSQSVVAHFQELLLRRLLLEDTPQDLVELSAVALLPLLLSEPSAFGPLSASIAQAAGAQGDARAAQAVGAALAQLGQGLQAHSAALAGSQDSAANVMRAATRQFRQQLCQLVADVRGLIRMR